MYKYLFYQIINLIIVFLQIEKLIFIKHLGFCTFWMSEGGDEEGQLRRPIGGGVRSQNVQKFPLTVLLNTEFLNIFIV